MAMRRPRACLPPSEEPLSISSFVLAPRVEDIRKKAFETQREIFNALVAVFAAPSACCLEAARR